MQRPTKQTRGPNALEKEFQSWLKERPCCISGQYGVSVHHMYGSAFKHNKILIGHLACLPLHEDYHQGEYGIHKNKNDWLEANGPQAELFIKEVFDYQNETCVELPYAEVQAIIDWGR